MSQISDSNRRMSNGIFRKAKARAQPDTVLILRPKSVPVEIAARHIQRQQVSHARRTPKLTASFKTALQLRAKRFHGQSLRMIATIAKQPMTKPEAMVKYPVILELLEDLRPSKCKVRSTPERAMEQLCEQEILPLSDFVTQLEHRALPQFAQTATASF